VLPLARVFLEILFKGPLAAVLKRALSLLIEPLLQLLALGHVVIPAEKERGLLLHLLHYRPC